MGSVINIIKSKSEFITKIFITFLIVFSLINIGVFKVFDALTIFMLIIVYSFIKRTNINAIDTKTNILSLIMSFMFSISLILGGIINNNFLNYEMSYFQELFKINNILSIVGIAMLVYFVIINIYSFFDKINIKNDKKKYNTKKMFWVFFAIMMISWTIYLLSYYPVIISYDSAYQIKEIMGIIGYDNHHPVLHTIIIKVFLDIGKSIFNSYTIGCLFYSLFQMISLSLIFSYTLLFIYKREIKFKYIILFLLYFTLSPAFGFYSVTMWKDVLFGGVFLLFGLYVYSLYEKRKLIKIKDYIVFILLGLLFALFRNNGIYILLLISPFMIYKFIDKKKMIGSFLIMFATYFILIGPVYKMIGIEKTESAEYISIPLEQVGRIVKEHGKIDDNEAILINKLIDIGNLSAVYNPGIVDAIKMSESYNPEVFENNKLEYLKLWASLVFKNIGIACEAYASITLGYWYPNLDYWAVYDLENYDNVINVQQHHLTPIGIMAYTHTVAAYDIPFISLLYSVALYFWIALLFYIYSIKKKVTNTSVYILAFALLLTLLVASPVYGEFRYIFGVVCSMPLLISIPFMKERKNEDEI